MDDRNRLYFLSQNGVHAAGFNLGGGQVFGQACQRAAVPVVGNQRIGFFDFL